MAKLVIVESPAKAKTIKKYLGGGYKVVASMGHLRDLPKSKMGVDLEHDFEPSYINIRGKGSLIKSLKQDADKSSTVLLATDPDREGEAISWHLCFLLGLDLTDKNRITFNEITKTGVKEGLKNIRRIDLNLVDAQQARRVIDRIVGYKLSPFLWKKIGPGLSAGRVQSVAVRLIVDRENEIKQFVSKEFWTVEAKLKKKDNPGDFTAKLASFKDKKTEITTSDQAQKILNELQGVDYKVSAVKKGERNRAPVPPFTTSTMQQEASKRLYFQAARTMRIAQQLYEGVDVKGRGAMGLITYMRTDSLRVSAEAQADAAAFIKSEYGEPYLPKQRRVYRSKNAQDGHEAVRPTVIALTPNEVKSSLSAEQYKLYKLIWERFMASQMANAVYDTLTADIKAGDYLFKAAGSTVKFKGFTALYVEGGEDRKGKEEKEAKLPPLVEGEVLKLLNLEDVQHFTQPPFRYSEASLTKTLEELGIGRPSTYVPIIGTIIKRGYVEKEKRFFVPTALGEVTTSLMKDEFQKIVDVSFTAKIEEEFDKIANGDFNWKTLVREFYTDFETDLEKAEKDLEGKRLKLPDEETGEICDKCGKPMVIKTGRFGRFMACSGYPDCKNAKPITKPTDGICPKCGGNIKEKTSKKKKIYYGCENFPTCDFMSWDPPVSETCPKCGNTMFQKKTKAKTVYCANEGCGYVKPKS